MPAPSHYLNQWWLVYRHIYASPGLNELIAASLSLIINLTKHCWTDITDPITILFYDVISALFYESDIMARYINNNKNSKRKTPPRLVCEARNSQAWNKSS